MRRASPQGIDRETVLGMRSRTPVVALGGYALVGEGGVVNLAAAPNESRFCAFP